VNKYVTDPGATAILWKLGILALAVFINLALAVRLVWGPQSIFSYNELREQYARLGEELKNEKTKNAALSKEIRLLQADENYVEKIIRQRLNYVKENEIIYMFEPDQDALPMGAAADERKN
jgi:cell division protein FtsB